MGKNQRPGHGMHSSKHQTEIRSLYLRPGGPYELGQEKICDLTEIHEVDSFPRDFLKQLKNGKNVHLAHMSASGMPAYLGKRGTKDDINTDTKKLPQNTRQVIHKHWQSINDALTTITPVPVLLVRCLQVLSQPAQAILWHACVGNPQKHEALILLMNRFLALIKLHLVPRARALLHYHAPQQLKTLEPIYARVKSILGDELAARDCIDWEGIFFCAAVKEGSSEIIHIDWNDALALLTFRARLNLMLALRTRILAHCGATVTSGGRLVITCFSDSQTVEQSLFGTAKGFIPVVVF
ncbi:hypothetical protein C8R44DRAFT_730766 [Mycena epipterygia]|nr:hypothetical protein C8R44DRAFT_730766 [Mycena epipterygia]